MLKLEEGGGREGGVELLNRKEVGHGCEIMWFFSR